MSLKIDKQLQHFIEMLPCCVYWKDIAGVYMDCNALMLQLAGLVNPMDIKGKTDFDLPWKANAAAIRAKDLKVIQDKATICSEEPFTHPNGTLTTYLSYKTPFFSENSDKILGVFGMLVDISFTKQAANIEKAAHRNALAWEHRHSEQAQIDMLANISDRITGHTLPENTSAEEYTSYLLDYLDNIIACMPGSVYWKDRNGIYRGGNDYLAHIAGFKSREEIVGKTDRDFAEIFHWSEDMLEGIMHFDMAVMESGTPKYNHEELPFTTAEGHEIIQLSNKVPLFNKNNQVIGLVGISLDITELKKTQEALIKAKEAAEDADIAKTELIANMSHDIRTPLSGVVGLGIIVEQEIEDPQIKAKVHDMVKSADELLNMLNDILDIVSLGNITVKDIREEPFDLAYLVQTIVDLEKSSTELKNIRLMQHIDPNIPPILVGDHKKIYHILLNLVGNAIKFTKKGDVSIHIKLTEKSRDRVHLLFEVCDTGVGIPAKSLSKVFELFYKVTASYKGQDKSHGVGLHIVKTYTELLGGTVSVESKVNKGSKFSLTLQLKIADKDAKPQNLSRDSYIKHTTAPLEILAPPPPKADPIHIPDAPEFLLIEDNTVACLVAKTMIQRAHCNVTIAIDGETGLAFAKSKHFDIILTDVGLPGISGIEFAQQLRQYEKEHQKSPVPIVAMTGHAEGKIRDECIAAGMNEVRIKPIRPEVLEDICKQYHLRTPTRQS